MLSIGEFSKICEVSAKTLRYYDEIGLIHPEEINPVNGYRYYSIRQLKRMLFINRLKSYSFSLEEMPDWIAYTLDRMGRGGQIGNFKYSSAGAHLLSAILTRATGMSAREYANVRLFQRIGMNTVPDFPMEKFGFDELFGHRVRGWVKDPSQHSTGGWGLTLTPLDMARFGFLYLNGGAWNGEQIVPEDWIRKSISMNANKYGYLWWLGEADGVPAYMALGDGGNAICCIPKHDLVVAIASSFMTNSRDRWTLIAEHIIPAIID
ncbi:MerR family transcriptional regulator [Paenibacillus sp. J5C_2022]|uniref:MerR family transcriptional regulator n=1 Tax=Paenibacillus sp. J5C2022 TaxID=2977129 RepID=UPI0021D16087|nr:MerR family transcriptional regulator [Paenibacillus sp. J5C2022]MCU6709515.1 MerR family transcriptional regulator [Paenibacillus sp. J5C2022]